MVSSIGEIFIVKMFVDVNDIYLHRDPVDFRKAINGLSVIVEQQMKLSPFDVAKTIVVTENEWHWLLLGYDIRKMKGHSAFSDARCIA